MTRLHIGLIGAGGMGTSLAAAVEALHNATICAIADPLQEAASRVAAELAQGESTDLYSDIAEMLPRDDIEAVIVAVPNFLHAPLVRQAAEAGKHVFCEKPLALNVADARSM